MATRKRTVVWYRAKDLRIHDHEPLRQGAQAGDVLPVFVVDPFCFGRQAAVRAPHRTQYLLGALAALAENLSLRGSRLLVLTGDPVERVTELAERWQADAVVAHRWAEPRGRACDAALAQALGPRLSLYEGETLLPPGALRTQTGGPFAVFTPYYRAFQRSFCLAPPVAAPKRLTPWHEGFAMPDAAPLPTATALSLPHNSQLPKAGEAAGRARLKRFLDGPIFDYHTTRDRMDLALTSGLSVDLKFGTVSARAVYSAAHAAAGATVGGEAFLRQLVWREFTHSLLWHHPRLLDEPFQARFRGFPYLKADEHWQAWAQGRTGYPVVDAAARQLLTEGFVHNRARMIAASFLCKHLRLPYGAGEAHYLKHLVDGDVAQNNAGWQWSAGCGCDAMPYFRVFNPVTQGRKFDPAGDYVRKHVPELANMPARYIHSPWTAKPEVLSAAGVRLGVDYPRPIVEHAAARAGFLKAASDFLRR